MAFFQAKSLWINHLADDVAALVLDRPGSKVNRIDAQMLEDLETAVARIAQEGRFALLIVRSAKPASFCHGFDVEFLSSLQSAEDFVALARRGQALCAQLARLPLPSVAVIAGPCLGAGLELALACDYRVAVERPAVTLGLSPLDLGLVPAWGGSQRLPRLIGLEHSLQMILGSKRLAPREAVAWGLADDLAADGDEPPAFLAEPHKHDGDRFVRRTWRQQLLESTGLGRRLLLRGAARVVRERLPDALPAPAEAVEALRLAYAPGAPEPGLAHERLALGRLGPGPAVRHLLEFRRRREAQRGQGARLAEGPQPRRVAVLGAGPASLNVLFQAVTHGQEVIVRAPNEGELGTALMGLFRRLETEARRGVLTPAQAQKCLGAIRGTYTWTNFDTIDLAFDPGGPESLLPEAATHAPPGTLLACGSVIESVARLQERIAKPERVGGLHLVEPAGAGSVAEVVATIPATERRLAAWAASLGHTPITVADRPGRLVLRVLWPALNEATLLVRQGLSVAQIDTALRRFGLALGPLEYLDLLGLDVAAQLAPALQPIFTGRLDPTTGFAAMAEAGWTGKQAGMGFYQYDHGQRRAVHTAAETLWRTLGDEPHAAPLPPLSDADQARLAVERIVARLVAEAERCLEEQVVADEATLELALCLAFWPPHRGGPLQYAREQGVPRGVA